MFDGDGASVLKVLDAPTFCRKEDTYFEAYDRQTSVYAPATALLDQHQRPSVS